MASTPLKSGICRSMRVTSGRCDRNCSIASRPLDASATSFMSGSALTSVAIPSRRSGWSSTVRILISLLLAFIGVAPQKQLSSGSGARRFVGNRGRHLDLDLRAGAGLAPQVQSRSDSLRPFTNAAQAPMSGELAVAQYVGVNTRPIVANTQTEPGIFVSNLRFDPMRARVSER